MANTAGKLSNESFLTKAPANVVEGFRKRLGELEVIRAKTKGKLEELNC